jgi:AbrB family looped-hinge helix DNA binding protein
VGTKVGILGETTRFDSKHRVVLPEAVRRRSGIRSGSKLKVTVKNRSIVMTKNVQPDEFIEKMEGILKKGSTVPVADPVKLKEIWTNNEELNTSTRRPRCVER